MTEPREDVAPSDAAEETSDAKRIEQQALWVDMQIRGAIERGDFDNLPGAGKPIKGLDGRHDPDWWAKQLIERERLTGLAPPAIGLRGEDAQLDERLDRHSSEAEVRRMLADFNDRVIEARRQLTGGPPVITMTRDIEDEVAAWRARRIERARALREKNRAIRDSGDSVGAAARTGEEAPPRRWWSRLRRRRTT